MAMATPQSLAPVFVFLLVISTAPAARIVADNVPEACSKTQFPKICIEKLTVKPDSKTATVRQLAELFVNMVGETGSGMAAFVNGKLNGAKDDSVFKCYDSCSDDVEEAVAHLNGLIREPTDAKFLELKSWLSSTLGGASTCEDACKEAPKGGDKDDVVNQSLEFEKLLRVTLDLITEASGSMAADIALPPSDASAPSYRPTFAEAPSESYSSSAESPGPSSDSSPADGASSTSGPSSDSSPAYGASSTSGSSPDTKPVGSGAAGAPAASNEDSDAPAVSKEDASDAPGASADVPAASEGDSSSAPGLSNDGASNAPAPSEDDSDDMPASALGKESDSGTGY